MAEKRNRRGRGGAGAAAAPGALAAGLEFEARIESLAVGGAGVARHEGVVAFIEGGVPGDVVQARVARAHPRFVEARLVAVLHASPERVPPVCPHFPVCGASPWRHIAYGAQLGAKRAFVVEALSRLGGVSGVEVADTIPSPETLYSRNKMTYAFAPCEGPFPEGAGGEPAPGVALGLHVRERPEAVFNLDVCFLQSGRSAEVVREARRLARESGLSAFGGGAGRGFWRALVIREGKRTGETMIEIVTTEGGEAGRAGASRMASALAAAFPDITAILHTVRRGQDVSGGETRVLLGPGRIAEVIGGVRLTVSASAFLQTNTLAAELLYEEAARAAGLAGSETVWDLYSGAGAVALFLSRRVRRVVGFEVVPEAVSDAVRNARDNGAENCAFVSGDVRAALLGKSARGLPRPDVVVADPPRAGMHPEVIRAVLEAAPRRVVVLSCDPATLARDIGRFLPAYEVRSVQPVDMFPHTPHVECVVGLERTRARPGGMERALSALGAKRGGRGQAA